MKFLIAKPLQTCQKYRWEAYTCSYMEKVEKNTTQIPEYLYYITTVDSVNLYYKIQNSNA